MLPPDEQIVKKIFTHSAVVVPKFTKLKYLYYFIMPSPKALLHDKHVAFYDKNAFLENSLNQAS